MTNENFTVEQHVLLMALERSINRSACSLIEVVDVLTDVMSSLLAKSKYSKDELKTFIALVINRQVANDTVEKYDIEHIPELP